jgi:hypothetical protein
MIPDWLALFARDHAHGLSLAILASYSLAFLLFLYLDRNRPL